MIGYSKRIEKIIRESAFDNNKKKAGLKFNTGLVLIGVRTTGPRCPPQGPSKEKVNYEK